VLSLALGVRFGGRPVPSRKAISTAISQVAGGAVGLALGPSPGGSVDVAPETTLDEHGEQRSKAQPDAQETAERAVLGEVSPPFSRRGAGTLSFGPYECNPCILASGDRRRSRLLRSPGLSREVMYAQALGMILCQMIGRPVRSQPCTPSSLGKPSG
jgi:hypothetical protein